MNFASFKSTFFTEQLWMTASLLQQFLALYFATIYNWKLSSSEKLLVWKKSHSYISTILHIYNLYFFLFFFSLLFFSFSLTNALLYQLRKVYVHSEQPNVLLDPRHRNTMILTNSENLNSILNVFH